MPTRGFDHAVLMFPSMEAAEALPRRLGFATTPRSAHPFGTGNVLVQFDDHNLEYLAVLDADRVAADAPDGFSFARFNRDWLLRNGPGFAMLVIKSVDRVQDSVRFENAGFMHTPYAFARAATAPDGSHVEVSFELLFAEAPVLAEAGLFTCRHLHPPQHFYRPDYQRHANGARCVKGAVLAALEPQAVAETLALATGGSAGAGPYGPRIGFGPDHIDVATPVMIREIWGFETHVAPAGLRHVALRIGTASLEATRRALAEGGVAASERAGAIVVAPEEAAGTAYLFEPVGP